MIARRLLACLLAPLFLSGCLLPQPDTPPVPPFSSGKRTGTVSPIKPPEPTGGIIPQPDTPPVTPNKGATTSGDANAEAADTSRAGVAPMDQPLTNGGQAAGGQAIAAPSAAVMAPGTLSGVVEGLTVTSVDLTREGETTPLGTQAVGSDRSFSFGVPEGRYTLTLHLKDRVARLDEAFEVLAGKTRHLTIALSDDPLRAMVSEEVAIAAE